MHIGRWAHAIVAATALLTGCSGFWDPPANSGGGGTGTATGVFYVLNSGLNPPQIAVFAFTSGSTTPAAVSGGPYQLGAAGLALAISPNGEFLYASTASGIYAYSIGATGALTLLNGNQAISGDTPTSMVVDSSSSWLVESTSGSGVLSAIPVSPTTGLYNSSIGEQTLASGLPSTTVAQIAISPANSTSPYVFVAMGGGGTAVIPFTAGNTNPFGSVSTIRVKNTTGGDNAVAVDPTNRLLYVGETVAVSSTANAGQTGGLRVFTIGSTSINEITGSPYPTGGTGPAAILPTASYVYVANRAVSGSTTGNITGFSITSAASVFSLSTVSTVAAGTSTTGLATDSTSTYVLAINSGGSPDLNTYTYDATTSGKLDASKPLATGTDPVQASVIVAVP